jgi:hypothetical protein
MRVSHLKENNAWLYSEQICDLRLSADAAMALKTNYTEIIRDLRDIAVNKSEIAVAKLRSDHELL